MRGGKQIVSERGTNLATFWGKDGEFRWDIILIMEWRKTINTKDDETFYQTKEAILWANGENRVNIRWEGIGWRERREEIDARGASINT